MQLYNVKEFRLKPKINLFVNKVLKKKYILCPYGLDDRWFRVQVPSG
jgi:hypothetical protein